MNILDLLGVPENQDRKCVSAALSWQHGWGVNAEINDPDQAQKLFDAFCTIRIGAESYEDWTDSDDVVCFTMSDGTKIGTRFTCHCVNASDPHRLYYLENAEAFWQLYSAALPDELNR